MKKFTPSKQMKWLFIGVLVLIGVCVLLTILIIRHATSKNTLREPWLESTEDGEAVNPNREITLENVYITAVDEHTITFLYQGNRYTLPCKTDSDVTGIANILIKNQKIQKITLKNDYISGMLISYTEDQVEVEGYGVISCEPNVNVYEDYEDEIRAISMNNLVVGASNLKYYVADDCICAVVQSEKTQVYDIRVLIKNGIQPTYSSLYLTADTTFWIEDTAFSAHEPVNVKQYLVDNQKALIKITCENGGRLYITDENGNITSSGYEGLFYVRAYDTEKTRVALINEIEIEDYVRYVLPSEMPDSFSYEALKTQAVCARTFAYSQMTDPTYAAYGANLDDTTSFQVYNEIGTKEITDRAVADTTGEVITCDGELITCYYYSTNPGVSEDMEVWEKEQLPYIHKYSTLLSGKTVEELGLEQEENLVAFLNGAEEAYDSCSPFYRWTAQLDLSNVCDEKLGKLKYMLISKRSTSGYILRLTLVYEGGTKMLSDENDIRAFFAPYMTSLQLSNGTERTNFPLLPSDCFYIASVTEDLHYVLKGGGYGHAIGMSQYGANAMGQAGYTYEDIIHFFYTNVEITLYK